MKSKTKALTPEEKLSQALLPREEWPYELPKGWVWTRMEYVYQVNPKSKCEDEAEASFVPMEKISAGFNFEFQFDIKSWKDIKKGHPHFEENDVAFAKISPCFENRKSFIAHNLINGIGAGTTELVVLRQPLISSLYTYWLVNSERFISGGVNTYSGTVGQQRINMDYVRNYPVPLPPLPEQQRIVDKIESLFSKLDEAGDRLQKVLDGYEARRAAILHEAFSGKWTGDHGAGDMSVPKGWRKVKFTDVAEVKSNLVSPEDYPDFPHIAPDNIEKMTGRLLSYNTVQEDGVKSPKHHFFPGQILYSKIRPYLSKVVTVNFEGLCSADMYPIEAKENARYLWYYMLSNEFLNQAVSGKSRTVLPKINRKELANIQVLIPGLSLQQFIVDKLDAQFKNERMAKEVIQKTLIQIDLMKKSILARAFRGELGTQDPSDPSALALLKECVMEGKEGSKS